MLDNGGWTAPIGGVELQLWKALAWYVVAHVPLAARAVMHRMMGMRYWSAWLHPAVVGFLPVGAGLSEMVGVPVSSVGSFARTSPLLVGSVLLTSLLIWLVALGGLVSEQRLQRLMRNLKGAPLVVSYLVPFIASALVVGQTLTFVVVWFGRQTGVGPPITSGWYGVALAPAMAMGVATTCILFWVAGISLAQVFWPRSSRALRALARGYGALLRDPEWEVREFGISRLAEVAAYAGERQRGEGRRLLRASVIQELERAADSDTHDAVRTRAAMALRRIQERE